MKDPNAEAEGAVGSGVVTESELVESPSISTADLQDEKVDKVTGIDEDDEEFDLEKFPVRVWTFMVPGLTDHISFNPLVSGIGISALWGLAIWSMMDPEGSNETLVDWRGKVTLYFTWLFIGCRAIFFIFIVIIGFKFSHVKLGHKDEKPEFSTAAYFTMIFAAGIAVGLFVYGVSEPLWHQQSHWFAEAGYHSQNEIDMYALNLTINNWAISGWAPYLVVAICMGLAGHRFKLPLTFRSCLYPILQEYTWGWIGDLIDGFTIVVTVAGVCTSLGLGAIQLVAGFQFLGWVSEDASEEKMDTIRSLTIWGITVIATVSVMSGIHAGVKFLSFTAFLLGMFLLTMVFILDDTKFLLNLTIQEIGYFMQHSLLELNFWTDAFGQLRDGEGRASDGNAPAVWWMDAWTVFYQAWWISWSAFVGLFVARISKGRTIGEVVAYSLFAPILYIIVWFSTWGGIGLRQSRQADELMALGSKYFNDTKEYAVPGSDFCYDVPQGDVVVDGQTIFTNYLLGVTPVCKFDSSKADQSAFNVLYSFSFPDELESGFGPILTGLFLLSLAIYFATSSDSGSLVVDHLSANGRKKHHWIQRLFWAVTEGAVATALLSAGGSAALQGVQAASIVAGLPFQVLLCYLLESIWVFVNQAALDPDNMEFKLSSQAEFAMPVYGGIFNIFEWAASGGNVNPKRIERGMHLPTQFQAVEFVKALFLPFLSLNQVLNAAYPKSKKMNFVTSAFYGLLFITWIALFISYGTYSAMLAWGWAIMLSSAVLLASIRNGFRERYNLRSNVLGDFIASCFLWPQVLTQMRIHCVELGLTQDHAE